MARTGIHLSLVLLALLALVGRPAVAGPQIGFNVWDPLPHVEDPLRIVREVESMHAAGFRRVVLLPFVYVDLTTGRVRQVWPGDPFASMTDVELAAGVRRAKALGMTVGVTPFVEPRRRSVGRNEIAFTPATRAGQVFWDDYRDAVVHFARLAKDAGADEYSIGSELVGMDYDRANAAEWKKLIDAAADAFGRDVGYSTQHWTFDQEATLEMIWKHPRITHVSLSAYLTYQPEHGHRGLATPADARGEASDSPAFIDTVDRNLEDFYAKRLKPTAAAAGKPIRIGEFGLPPFDTAVTIPWQWTWPKETPYDPTEAANTWRAVIAFARRHPEIQSIDAWIWGWSGGFPGERFYLRPDAKDDTPGDGFDESRTTAVFKVLQEAAK